MQTGGQQSDGTGDFLLPKRFLMLTSKTFLEFLNRLVPKTLIKQAYGEK